MRYLCPVSDFTHLHISHLSASETRLMAGLARPKLIAMICIVTLTAFGWLALGSMLTGGGPGWEALCRPAAWVGGPALALDIPMWAAMTLAMMLPTAGPMVLTYAEIADTAAGKGEAVVSPLVLTAGYVAVWLGFAVVAAILQWMLLLLGGLQSGSGGQVFAGVIFIGAGLYQFSALKQACLAQCQRPFPFFFANWTTEAKSVLRLGVRQGLFCLGCCWAMMLIMFAVGAMNVVWMAALGALMTIEKLMLTARFSKVLGVASVTIGCAMLIGTTV